MDLSVRLTTRPVTGVRPRAVILVIIIIAAMMTPDAGYGAAMTVSMIFSAMLTGRRGGRASAVGTNGPEAPLACPGRAA